VTGSKGIWVLEDKERKKSSNGKHPNANVGQLRDPSVHNGGGGEIGSSWKEKKLKLKADH